ncbi:MAG: hypothetical protein JXB15_10375 [Anaerolineales bacterium]|nr:hypothetical protein [Anaerolineales bacterium]
MKKFWREYRVELIALVVILLGVFLLVEQWDIRVTLLRATVQTVDSLKTLLGAASDWVVGYVLSMTLSDLVGWALIIATTIFVLWRIRYRFIHSERLKATYCPRCYGELVRVHRTLLDRLLGGLFFPGSRRYRCSNSDCRWSGLRLRRPHQHTPGPAEIEHEE